MRRWIAISALALCTAAAPAEKPGSPGFGNRAVPSLPEDLQREGAVCRDKIHAVRAERNLPMLDRQTADPAEPLLIAAVDRRIDGCSVMVMRSDLSDIRPLPEVSKGSPALRPARERRTGASWSGNAALPQKNQSDVGP